MKNLFLKAVLIFAFLTSTVSSAQSCPVPEELDKAQALGTWKGSFTSNGEFKSFTLNLSSKKDDIVAQLTIPSINNKKIDTKTKICRSQELHVRFEIDNKEYELTGKPKNNSMSGKLVSVNSSTFPNNSNEEIVNEVFSLKKVK